jgi:hypothetical protein
MGTFSRIYATSGNDISLTDTSESTRDRRDCEQHYEASDVSKAAGMLKGLFSAAKEEEEADLPTCESFKIRERSIFDSTGSIDIQELLRNEFGTGHEFQNVSVKLRVGLVDYIFNIFTFGIANSQTVEVHGNRYSTSIVDPDWHK